MKQPITAANYKESKQAFQALNPMGYLKEKAAEAGLEVSHTGPQGYCFLNPETENWIELPTLDQAFAFIDGLIWGNKETRP